MKDKKFIITIALIVLLNGIVLAGWLYLFSYLEKQNDLIREERQRILMNEKKLENNRSLKDLMNKIADEKQKIDSVFLDKENIINFIESLESVSGKTGASIKIGNINIDNRKEKNVFLQFSLTGDFVRLFHYLVLLENLPYLINIEKTGLKKAASNEWRADFEVSVNSFTGT